jgi:hypothetical protein
MRKGWTHVERTNRWVTTRQTKDGPIALSAFPSGSWSITHKAYAEPLNPQGIVTSSWERGEVWHNLADAMVAAEAAAKQMGAVDSGTTGS